MDKRPHYDKAMPEVRALSLEQMKDIYTEYMEDDFPRAELRPFVSVKRNYEKGCYPCFGFYEGERFLGYACFYTYPGAKEALMDYFAVVPELRDRGVGSAFLKAMASQIPNGCKIFIEAESADSAKNETDRIERERRLSFYERNGAMLTGVRCLLFTVDYEILMMPDDSSHAASDIIRPEDYMDMIHELYIHLYSTVFGRLCRLYVKE